jgi:hypothetical protein
MCAFGLRIYLKSIYKAMYAAPVKGTDGNVKVFGRDGARADIWALNDAHNNTV